MQTVRKLLDEKGRDIWSISPDATVLEAIGLMEAHGIGALLVLRDGKLVGIVSERDYARKVILKGKSSKDTPVRDIMTAKVVCVSTDRSIEECMAIMTGRRIRHLPVLDGQRLVGVVSIGDVVRATIAEKDFIIEKLTEYITGG